MITISFTIPSMPPELSMALTLMLAPLLLMVAYRFAASMASVLRHFTE